MEPPPADSHLSRVSHPAALLAAIFPWRLGCAVRLRPALYVCACCYPGAYVRGLRQILCLIDLLETALRLRPAALACDGPLPRVPRATCAACAPPSPDLARWPVRQQALPMRSHLARLRVRLAGRCPQRCLEADAPNASSFSASRMAASHGANLRISMPLRAQIPFSPLSFSTPWNG